MKGSNDTTLTFAWIWILQSEQSGQVPCSNLNKSYLASILSLIASTQYSVHNSISYVTSSTTNLHVYFGYIQMKSFIHMKSCKFKVACHSYHSMWIIIGPTALTLRLRHSTDLSLTGTCTCMQQLHSLHYTINWVPNKYKVLFSNLSLSGGRMVRAPGRGTHMSPLCGFETRPG